MQRIDCADECPSIAGREVMMKKWIRKGLCLGLAAIMTAGLCACSGNDGTDSPDGGGKKGSDSSNAALAKENVYKFQEISMPELVDENNGSVNVRGGIFQDGKVYFLLQVYDWMKTNSRQDFRLMSVNADGTDMQFVSLQMSGDKEGDQQDPGDSQEPEADQTEPDDGSQTDQPASEDSPESNTDIATEPGYEASPSNIYEDINFNNMVLADGGMVYGLKQWYYQDYSDPENPVSEDRQFLCCWDGEGKLVWEKELEPFATEDEWVYLNQIVKASDGGLTLLLNGDKAYKMNMDAEGNLSEKMELSEETSTALSNIQYMIPRRDGTFILIYSSEDDWTKQFIADYDLENDKLGEAAEVPSSLTWNGLGNVAEGMDADLIYSGSDGIYTFNAGDTESKIKMNYINSDLYISDFTALVELGSETFMAIFRDNYEDGLKLGLFNYVDPSTIADKVVLVLAGNSMGGDIKRRVVEYNRASDQYRIVVKEYYGYTSYEDYEAGITKLNNDIITGQMPDILLTSELPMDNYIAKGWIADINKLIENDEELSQVEFLQNVFDAFSNDGKLYYVVPGFSVNTVIGKTALVGDRESWTMADMQQVLASMGEGTSAIGNVTPAEFMNMVMRYCGNDFVDVSTGKCSFNTSNFIEMMEFAKTLPQEYDQDEWNAYYDNYESQYRENRTLLSQIYIYSVSGLNYYINGYFGEPVSFVGFPTESGKGSYIEPDYNTFALSARSKNLDGAWDFVRYYLTDEYQKEAGNMPVNKALFLEKAQEALQRPYYIDYDTKEKVEYDDTFWMNGEEIKLDPMSQEQIDQVTDFIQSVDRRGYNNPDILNIINEEVEAFYSGQKSAQDVADVIQRRAQLFVDENR